jgi:RNA polymerase sigma-70 factor (ECF subfamily)
MTGHPLDEVAAGVARRQPDAYVGLCEVMADRLFAFAYRVLVQHQEAEDAVQQSFLELAQLSQPPDNGRRLEAWLFTSVRYNCLDIRRRRTRQAEVFGDLLHKVTGEAGIEDSYALGLDLNLERALLALTPSQRQVIHLKHVERLDGHEIAEIMGSNRVAVYASAARAERRLRQLLRDQTPAGPDDGDNHGPTGRSER